MSNNSGRTGGGRPQMFDQESGGYAGGRYTSPPRQPRPQNRPPEPVRRPVAPSRGRAPQQSARTPAYTSRPAARGSAEGPRSYYSDARHRSAPSGMAAAPPRRKKKRRGSTAIVVVLIVVLVLGTGVFTLYNIYQNRMDGTVDMMGVLPDEGKTLPEFKGSHVSFLVCGLDYDSEGANGYATQEKVGRTDMILYVHFNIEEGKIFFLQIPRDTFVGEKYPTGGTYKMNALYYCAADTQNRMAALSKVFNEQYKLPVDFYVTIDLDALKALVDINGSIKVYVPMTISDPDSGDSIDEGWQYLQGDDLEFFLRNRYSPNYNGQGDIARLRTQQSFYSALWREFKQLTPTDLMRWMNTLTYYVKTDKDLTYLASVALKALDVDGANLTFVRPACGSVGYGGHSQVSLVAEDMAEVLNLYFRAGGEQVPASDLPITTVPIAASSGVIEREVKTMADVQSAEPAA